MGEGRRPLGVLSQSGAAERSGLRSVAIRAIISPVSLPKTLGRVSMAAWLVSAFLLFSLSGDSGKAGGSGAPGTVHLTRTDPDLGHLQNPELADFDGDSDLDLAGCGKDLEGLRLFRNDEGRFTRAESTATPVEDLCFDISPAHVNGDAELDLVVAEGDYLGVPERDPELVSLLGNGDGSFTEAARYPLSGVPERVETGDFNGDGSTDAVLTLPGSGEIELFLGGGNGAFTRSKTLLAGRNPTSLSSGDLDGDGLDDLVVVGPRGGGVFLFYGDAASGLVAADPYDEIGGASDVVVANLDGDDQSEVAVLGGGAQGLLIFEATGDRGLKRKSRLDAGPETAGVRTADFNGDGRLDLAANWDFNLAIYFARKAGDFSRATTFALGGGRRYTPDSLPFAAGPVNRDEFADAIVPTSDLRLFTARERLYECRGQVANLVGSDRREILRPNLGGRPAVIWAGKGDDIASGTDRGDLVCFGGGLDGGELDDGADTILAGGGDDDHVHGNLGNDFISGGRGEDLLGHDQFAREAGDDTLLGGAGRDLLDGGPGEDKCDGGGDADGAVSCERMRRIP